MNIDVQLKLIDVINEAAILLEKPTDYSFYLKPSKNVEVKLRLKY